VVSSGKRQFGRVVRVIVKSANGETTSIDGFDISFDVDKNLEPEPNKAKIKIYNLPEDFRNKLQLKDDSKITLEAGYRQTVAAIFEGNLTHALSGIEGPDWVTQITAEEGVKAYRSSYVAKSYGAGTPFKSVVEDIVKTFEGFKITPAITATLSSIGKSFPNGLTLDGQSAKVLNDILRGVGLGFSIQNGQRSARGATRLQLGSRRHSSARREDGQSHHQVSMLRATRDRAGAAHLVARTQERQRHVRLSDRQAEGLEF
jgi:hypothetical protein